MATPIRQLLHNSNFQLAYLLFAVVFLGILYINKDYSMPDYLLYAMLAIHIVCLIIRVVKPTFLQSMLVQVAQKKNGTHEDFGRRTMARLFRDSSHQQIHRLNVAESNLYEIEKILVNGSRVSNSRQFNSNYRVPNRQSYAMDEQRNVEVSEFTVGERYYDFLDNRRSFDNGFPRGNVGIPERGYLSQRQTYEDNNSVDLEYMYQQLVDTSPDAAYAAAGIKLSRKMSLLKIMRTYIMRLQSFSKDHDKKIDDKLKLIFGQRLEGSSGINTLTIQEVEKIVRSYRVRETLPRELFKTSKDSLTPQALVAQMEQLVSLVQNRPPSFDIRNRSSLFKFVMWHVRKMYNPETIDVVPYKGKIEPSRRQNLVIYEDSQQHAYYFLPGQVNCQYNIEQTFLFLFRKCQPKTRYDIIDSIEGGLTESSRLAY